MITLYHGSNMSIDRIDLNKCHPDKDFGKGFYLTDIREQAKTMALRRTRIVGKGSPIVTAYTLDEQCLNESTLAVKVFDVPCKEWALFVLANRSASVSGFHHEYDIIIGPVADDGVAFQLERYNRGMITLETLVEELTYRKLNRQYYFGTERAISKLIRL